MNEVRVGIALLIKNRIIVEFPNKIVIIYRKETYF